MKISETECRLGQSLIPRETKKYLWILLAINNCIYLNQRCSKQVFTWLVLYSVSLQGFLLFQIQSVSLPCFQPGKDVTQTKGTFIVELRQCIARDHFWIVHVLSSIPLITRLNWPTSRLNAFHSYFTNRDFRQHSSSKNREGNNKGVLIKSLSSIWKLNPPF